MPGMAPFTPASLWRVFFIWLAGITVAAAAVPNSPPPELSQIGRPDEAEAARILTQFRQSGILRDYFLEFELHALPRRGEARIFQGRMWGGRNQDGSVNRIEITDGEGRRHRLLVTDGPRASVWRRTDGELKELEADAMFAPLIPGVDATAFDLQRSYLSWPDARLQSTNRVLGRPAYAFLFPAPAGFASGASGVVAARAYFDTVFNQPLQSELLDRAGKRLKTLSVITLKTVEIQGPNGAEKQTLPKEVDFRNEVTRDKTRLQVNGIALYLEFPAGIFEPSALATEVPAPPPGRVTRLAP
jgi:hypothetical protein